MKLFNPITRIFAAVATTALLVTPIASADQGRRHHDGYRDGRHHGYNHNSRRGHHDRYNRADRRQYRSNQRAYNRGYRQAKRHYDRPYKGYRHTSRRYSYSTGPHHYRPHYKSRHYIGGHYAYHQRTRYVRDYRHYGLYDPPRGYHWVHDDDRGDAILASVATGAIIGLVVGAIAYD